MAEGSAPNTKPVGGLANPMTPSQGSTSTLQFGTPTSMSPKQVLFSCGQQPGSPFVTAHTMPASSGKTILTPTPTAQETTSGATVTPSTDPISMSTIAVTPAAAVTEPTLSITATASMSSASATVKTSTSLEKSTTGASGLCGTSKTSGNQVQETLTSPSSFGFVPSSSFAATARLPRSSGLCGTSKTSGNQVQETLTSPSSFGFVPSSSFAATARLPRSSNSTHTADLSQSTGSISSLRSSIWGTNSLTSPSSSISSAATPERTSLAGNTTATNGVGGSINVYGSPTTQCINSTSNPSATATIGLSGSANVFGRPVAPINFGSSYLSGAVRTNAEIQPAAPVNKVSRPKPLKYGDEFITFLIGQEGTEKKFGIHKSFACHYSPVLKRVLGSSTESPLLYHIEDTTEEAFSIFCQWVYEQALDDAWDSDITNQEAARLIVEVYVLAEKLKIPQLQNLAIEYFEEVLTRTIQLTNDLLSYCFENTKAGSPLRRLLIDLYTWDINKDELVDRVRRFPREILEDLVLSLKERCEKKGSTFSMHTRNIADFYVNDDE